MDDEQLPSGRLGRLRPRPSSRRRVHTEEYTCATTLPKPPQRCADDRRDTTSTGYACASGLRRPSPTPGPNDDNTMKTSPGSSDAIMGSIEVKELRTPPYEDEEDDEDEEYYNQNDAATLEDRVIRFGNIPRHMEKASRELWQKGCEANEKQDGTADPFDVVKWILTRKGGAFAKWGELEEGRLAIEEMRTEPLDVNRIMREMEEEAAEKERKEKRRQDNKWRYRARGPSAKKVTKTESDESKDE